MKLGPTDTFCLRVGLSSVLDFKVIPVAHVKLFSGFLKINIKLTHQSNYFFNDQSLILLYIQ